jgi:hypothetical protein
VVEGTEGARSGDRRYRRPLAERSIVERLSPIVQSTWVSGGAGGYAPARDIFLNCDLGRFDRCHFVFF